MVIKVRLPDKGNTILKFPDEMKFGDIKRAIDEEFFPEEYQRVVRPSPPRAVVGGAIQSIKDIFSPEEAESASKVSSGERVNLNDVLNLENVQYKLEDVSGGQIYKPEIPYESAVPQTEETLLAKPGTPLITPEAKMEAGALATGIIKPVAEFISASPVGEEAKKAATVGAYLMTKMAEGATAGYYKTPKEMMKSFTEEGSLNNDVARYIVGLIGEITGASLPFGAISRGTKLLIRGSAPALSTALKIVPKSKLNLLGRSLANMLKKSAKTGLDVAIYSAVSPAEGIKERLQNAGMGFITGASLDFIVQQASKGIGNLGKAITKTTKGKAISAKLAEEGYSVQDLMDALSGKPGAKPLPKEVLGLRGTERRKIISELKKKRPVSPKKEVAIPPEKGVGQPVKGIYAGQVKKVAKTAKKPPLRGIAAKKPALKIDETGLKELALKSKSFEQFVDGMFDKYSGVKKADMRSVDVLKKAGYKSPYDFYMKVKGIKETDLKVKPKEGESISEFVKRTGIDPETGKPLPKKAFKVIKPEAPVEAKPMPEKPKEPELPPVERIKMDPDILADIRNEIEAGEPGSRYPVLDITGDIIRWEGEPSSYPPYFKNKGFTKKSAVTAINKYLAGKKLTEKQRDMIENLYRSSGKEEEYLYYKNEAIAKAINRIDVPYFVFLVEDEEKVALGEGLEFTGKEIKNALKEFYPKEFQEAYERSIGKEPTTEKVPPTQEPPNVQYADVGGYDLAITKKTSGKKKKAPGAEYQSDYNVKPFPDIDHPIYESLELPEIVHFAKEINEGKYPEVKKRLKEGILGQFRITKGGKTRILARADLAKDPRILARVIAHESFHLADVLPDKVKKGTILGKIASLAKYQKKMLQNHPENMNDLISSAERSKARRAIAKILAEEKKASVEEKPDRGIQITKEFLLRVTKGTASKEENLLFRKIVNMFGTSALRKFMKEGKRFRLKKQKVDNVIVKDFDAAWNMYKEWLKKEAGRRGLVTQEEILDELKEASLIWKPFDTTNEAFKRYRFSPNELYADAGSILLVRPDLLKQVAPKYYNTFFNWLDKKPLVKKVYFDIQEILKGKEPAILQNRQERMEKMWELSNEESKKEWEQAKEQSKFKLVDVLLKAFVTDRPEFKKMVRKSIKAGEININENPDFYVEVLPWIESEVYLFYNVAEQAMGKLSKIPNWDKHLASYMFLERGKGTRKEMAGSLGLYGKYAEKQMDYLKTIVGEENFKKIKQAAVSLHRIWQEHVVEEVRPAGMYQKEIISVMEQTEDYVPYHVRKYGKKITAKVFPQYGTFSEIRNPVVALLLKGAAMIRAKNVKQIKDKILDFYKTKEMAEEIPRNVKYIKHKPGKGIIFNIENGKVKRYYVPQEMADKLNKNPYEKNIIETVGQAIGKYGATDLMKKVLVQYSLPWTVTNPIRDTIGTLKNIPISEKEMVKYIFNSLPEIYRYVVRRQMSDTIFLMHKRKVIPINRMWGAELDEASELDRIMTNYFLKQTPDDLMSLESLKKVLEGVDKTGRIFELATKVAGFKYLVANKERLGLSDIHIDHLVRNRVGTPNFKEKGLLTPIIDKIFLFSNIGIQGMLAAYESMTSDPRHYFIKTALYNILPKVLLWMAGAGAFLELHRKMKDSWEGNEKEWRDVEGNLKTLQEIVGKQSDYIKENYIVVPIGLAKNGDSVVVSIPQDHIGQIVGNITWRMLEAKGVEHISELLDYMSGQMPYSGFSPSLKAIYDVLSYIRGNNVWKPFYHTWAIPDRYREVAKQAPFSKEAMESHKRLLKHLISELGGKNWIRFNSSDIEGIKGEMDKYFDWPILSPVIARFLRVGKIGYGQEARRVLKKYRTTRAKELITRENAIENSVNKSIRLGKRTPDLREKLKIFKKLKEQGVDPGRWREFSRKYNHIFGIATESLPETIRARGKKEIQILKERGFIK